MENGTLDPTERNSVPLQDLSKGGKRGEEEERSALLSGDPGEERSALLSGDPGEETKIVVKERTFQVVPAIVIGHEVEPGNSEERGDDEGILAPFKMSLQSPFMSLLICWLVPLYVVEDWRVQLVPV